MDLKIQWIGDSNSSSTLLGGTRDWEANFDIVFDVDDIVGGETFVVRWRRYS